MLNFSGILEYIFQDTCLLDLDHIVRVHNEEPGLYVGGIVQCIICHSFYIILCYRSEEHTSELQSHSDLVCRLLLEKKKNNTCIKYRRHVAVTRSHQKDHRYRITASPRHRWRGPFRARATDTNAPPYRACKDILKDP